MRKYLKFDVVQQPLYAPLLTPFGRCGARASPYFFCACLRLIRRRKNGI